jgi:hypothetical protein
MKTIRTKDQDLQEMLDELKVGDVPIFDSVSNYEICRVPGGFIYKNEYVGMVFIPAVKSEKKIEKVIEKTETARVGRPKKVIEK